MGSPHVLSALRTKRARVAGELQKTERYAAKLRRDLNTIDATLNLFEPQTNPELIPAIRPRVRSLFFGFGEVSRLCYAALREAGKPMTTGRIVDYALAVKGLETDWLVRSKIRNTFHKALLRMVKRGTVRCIAREPEGWWELVG